MKAPSLRKICVLTGTRAEYGLLQFIMRELQKEKTFELQTIVTAAHLSPEFGLTWREIEKDGFPITEKVEMLLSGDTPSATAKAMGLGTIGFADAFVRLNPDLVVILGDRYEMLAAAQTALIARIPIAHIFGGDVTEGAFDEAIRHSISKMAQIHFTTNEDSSRRLRQMGEDPALVHTVGSPGLDFIRHTKLLSKTELEENLGFRFRKRNLLVTFHPATLDREDPSAQFRELLAALDALKSEDVGILFTKANSDPNGRIINALIDSYVASTPNACAHASLGQLRYLSAMSHVDAVVGNSSSGIYETPSFRKPTVDIGDRQRGRIRASSIIHCEPRCAAIEPSIRKAFIMDCSSAVNPYGDGHASEKIVRILRSIEDFSVLTKKRFFDIRSETST